MDIGNLKELINMFVYVLNINVLKYKIIKKNNYKSINCNEFNNANLLYSVKKVMPNIFTLHYFVLFSGLVV